MPSMPSRFYKLTIRACTGAASLLSAGVILGSVPGADWLPVREAVLFAGVYAFVLIGLSVAFGSEKSAWRFTSLADLAAGVRDTAVALAFLGALMLAVAAPKAVVVPTLIVTILIDTFLFGAAKLVRRMTSMEAREWFKAANRDPGGSLLLVGDLGSAETYLRSAERDRRDGRYQVVGLISSDPKDVGLIVRGCRVMAGPGGLVIHAREAAQRDGKPPAILFLSEDDLSGRTEDLGLLRAQGFKLLRRSRIQELNESNREPLRELSVEELLYRSPIHLPAQALESYLTGQRVLVTGAGGSIGSELCRQIAANGCAHLTLVDHSEFALFNIDMELSRLFPGMSRRAVMMDVRDREGVARVFEEERPALVFHAAALKHVHLVERNACQGVLTNVFGTRNVADAAARVSARQMVLISTDKAVAPSNVMGASKRVAEAVIKSCAVEGGPTYSAVRFGNVLGSAGSVVPIFSEQIQRGGPVTVTDPEVERYFMTIPEAVQLVLYSSFSDLDLKKNGRIYVLDMGVPVKIAKLAERMIQLHGKIPHKDIEIRYIGLRPGEKITEALVDDGETLELAVNGVFQIARSKDSGPISPDVLEKLEALSLAGEAEKVANLIFSVANQVRGLGEGSAGVQSGAGGR